MKLSTSCTSCPLHETRNCIVWGAGPYSSNVMFVAEAPGEWEDRKGTPFYHRAPAGMEFDRLVNIAGLERELCYVTNSAKCRPPENRDPKPAELANCRQWLMMELAIVRPKFLVTVGGVSTRNIMGEADMETIHGVPFDIYIPEADLHTIIIPVYHPAAGLRSPDFALKTVLDFAAVGKVVRREVTPAHYKDPLAGSETYNVLRSPSEVKEVFHTEKLIAADTETLDWDHTPYMISASAGRGSGYVIMADNVPAVREFGCIVARPDNITIIHNCLFDLDVFDLLGVYPSNIRDTMIMAYLLQSEPQGLKPLAFRHEGMVMKDYEDMIGLCSATLADGYLRALIQYDWPDPEPVLEIKPGGKVHRRKPWNIGKTVRRILSDLEKNKITTADLWDRWHKLDQVETGRDIVEVCLGEMPEGNLSMVDEHEAVWYAARDADATFRVYPRLWERVKAHKLDGVFEMDMGIVPMVRDMMHTGMKPNLAKLQKLGTVFGQRMQELEDQITEIAGGPINVGSPLQVAELLFGTLKIKHEHKHNKVSTNAKVMSQIVAKHPVVPMLTNWRGYQKLKTTYTDVLPTFIRKDGRIHPQITTTRTATGRLACRRPNLMNQPTRSEDGKLIRKAFEAREGAVLVSNDLSQIEFRVLADQSGDSKLLHVFRNGLDIHSITASNIFKLPVDKLDDMLHRYPSKRVGFGVVYGITKEGLQEQLLMVGLDPKYWTLERCQNLIDDWFSTYPGVEVYMNDLVAFALRHGYVEDMFGRRRYLPTLRSSSRLTRAEAVRQAGNMPIQSGAAGIFKKAMKNLVPIYRDFQSQGYICHPVIPIHDDLVFEVSEEIVHLWVPLCQDVMEHSVIISVPVLSEAKVGKTWGDQEKYRW